MMAKNFPFARGARRGGLALLLALGGLLRATGQVRQPQGLPADTAQLAVGARAVVQQLAQQATKRVASPTPNASVTALASPYTQVALTAKSGNQEASATLGVRVSTSWLLSVSLRQPFQERPARVTPLTLDGLGQGASGLLNVQYASKPRLSPSLPRLLSQQPAAVQDAFDAVRLAYLQRRGKIGKSAKLSELSAGTSANQAEQKLFDETTFRSLAGSLTPADVEALKAAGILAPSSRWVAGLSASIGRVQYDYIASLTAQQPSHLEGANRNLRAYLGYVLGEQSVLAASYTLQRHYQAGGGPITFYYPLGGAGTSTSQEVFVGQPALATTSRLSLEFRQLLLQQNAAGAPQPFLAFVPSAHLLTNVQRLALNSAFYFLKIDDADSAQKGLQGGIALGYLTGPRFDFQPLSTGFSAEVFIAVPFSLFDLSK